MGLYNSIDTKLSRLQLNARKRAFIYRSLHQLLSNGVMLGEAVESLYSVLSLKGKRKKIPECRLLLEMLSSLESGGNVSDALFNWCPYEEAAIVHAGEISGNLLTSFATALYVMEKRSTIRAMLAKAALYPLVLFFVAGILLYVISSTVVPNMARSVNPDLWTGPSYYLYVISQIVDSYWPIIILSCITIIALYLYSLPRLKGKLRIALDKAPPYNIYRVQIGSIFILSLSSMMKSGMGMHEAIEKLSERAQPWLKERLEAASYGLGMGDNLGDAFARSGHGFPDPMAVHFIQILSGYSGFETSFAAYGEYWIEESIRTIERLSNLVLYVGLVALGGLIVLTAAGLFGLQETLMDSLSR